MITFDPASLKDEFIAALRALHDFAEIILDDWEHMHEEDFDFADTQDLTVTLTSEFEFGVGADGSARGTVADIIALSKELPKSKVVDHKVYVSETRALIRVEPTNEAGQQLANHLDQHRASTSRRFETSFGDVRVALVNGYTPFAIHMMKLGEYDRDTYPTFHDYDLFIEMTFPAGTKEEVWQPLVPAFLFEVDDQAGMAFSPARRATYDELWPEEYDEEAYLRELDALRLRPLMAGPGVESLLRLYERAIGRENDPEQHFVGFVKVMEYVSATVINSERNAQLRRRLLSPRALAPDAAFIRDLAQLIEALRSFKKDSEALRLTVETCCDLVQLVEHAPPHQRALASITEGSTPQERKKAFDALSATFSATRNMFSHAKANYTMTGDECPDSELDQLTDCARVAAQQCVRWFAHSDVSLRIAD